MLIMCSLMCLQSVIEHVLHSRTHPIQKSILPIIIPWVCKVSPTLFSSSFCPPLRPECQLARPTETHPHQSHCPQCPPQSPQSIARRTKSKTWSFKGSGDYDHLHAHHKPQESSLVQYI